MLDGEGHGKGGATQRATHEEEGHTGCDGSRCYTEDVHDNMHMVDFLGLFAVLVSIHTSVFRVHSNI